jgi:hypothetical protein
VLQVLENDDSHNFTRQAAMHTYLAARGFRPTVCVANPLTSGTDPWFHRCFWCATRPPHLHCVQTLMANEARERD